MAARAVALAELGDGRLSNAMQTVANERAMRAAVEFACSLSRAATI